MCHPWKDKHLPTELRDFMIQLVSLPLLYSKRKVRSGRHNDSSSIIQEAEGKAGERTCHSESQVNALYVSPH